MTVVARVAGPKIRVFNTDGTSNLITLDRLPFGNTGGGKAAGDVTSVPAGWSEITFTNLIFDQEVDENPSIFDAGGINIAIFAYLIRSILGITPNTLNNNFYYQQERVTGVNRESTKDITGWIGGSIRQSQTSRYDPDITYWRIKKLAFVQNGKWRVLQLNTAIAGTADSANIINTPTEHIYEGDNTFGAGVFGTAPTLLSGDTDDVEITSLNAQSSGMYIGVKGRGMRTFTTGKDAGDITSRPEGWAEVNLTNQQVNPIIYNPTAFVPGRTLLANALNTDPINFERILYMAICSVGDADAFKRTLTKFYFKFVQYEPSPIEKRNGWSGWRCGILTSAPSFTNFRGRLVYVLTDIAYIKDGKWKHIRTAARGPSGPGVYSVVRDGFFQKTVTENIEGYGLGRYTFEGRLVEVLNPGDDVQGRGVVPAMPDSDELTLTPTSGTPSAPPAGSQLLVSASGQLYYYANGRVYGPGTTSRSRYASSSNPPFYIRDNAMYVIRSDTRYVRRGHIFNLVSGQYLQDLGNNGDFTLSFIANNFPIRAAFPSVVGNRIYLIRSGGTVGGYAFRYIGGTNSFARDSEHDVRGLFQGNIIGMFLYRGSTYIVTADANYHTVSIYKVFFETPKRSVLAASLDFGLVSTGNNREEVRQAVYVGNTLLFLIRKSRDLSLRYLGYSLAPTTPATPTQPSVDPRPLYNICKRVYLLKHKDEANAATKPIIVRKNTDGSLVPIDIDISSVLSDDINPLKRSNTVKWSDISHDRKSKIILSTFDTDPQIGDIKHASKLIVLSVGGGTPPVSGEFSKSSFINGTKTRNANELAFIDEVEKKIYLLNSSDDTWKDGSFDLYKKDKITTDISDSLRNEILSASRNHPLGEKYLKNGVATDNPLYAYDEYQGGVNNNLFPRYINNYSMAVEVGEFRSGIWRYEEDTFVFNAFKNSRDFQSDRSHNSSLYNKGRTIQFMYTPTFNASALRTIGEGGPWRAITSKLSTSNRHELLAYNSDGMIDWFRWTGTSVEKARTLPLKGFNLQYVTGIEWIGNNLYICDSGQRDNQIQKFSISTTDIQFVKTINNPVRADSLTLAQLCRVIEQQTTTTEEVCTKIPGGSRNVSSDWYSGILPIDELPVGISGRNLSLRIKINHNQYLDIGTLFLESSRPRTLK